MSASYKYDPFGRRIEKNINETITKYLYDKEDIIAEYDGNNQLLSHYIHGPGIDEPIAMVKNSQSYFYHLDGLGSVTGITDSNGSVIQRYDYDSFGNIVSMLDPNFKQPYTYTSREYDEETGLYYYRTRYYNAKIGRFITEDPIGLAGGINQFAYVGNNPVNWIDPWGLHAWPYSHSHSKQDHPYQKAYAETFGRFGTPWFRHTRFYPIYDKQHPYVREMIDKHEQYHHEKGLCDERGAYKEELKNIDEKLKSLSPDDHGRRALENLRKFVEEQLR
jgi:RHS repeat-associated protein